MQREEAKQAVSHIIDEYYAMRKLDPRDRFTTLTVAPQPNLHLSVGYRQDSKSGFSLELRIRKTDGLAARYAETIRSRYGYRVSVSRIERVEVPSRTRVLQATAGIAFPDRKRPLALGASVSHRDAMAGSVGLFVEWRSGPRSGRKGILSNSHVLALAGRARLDDPVYQPGRPDANPLLPKLQIGTLADFTVLSPAGSHELDAAVADLLDQTLVGAGNVIPAALPGCGEGGRRLSAVADCETLGPRPRVCKIGRSTGWTSGTVTAIGLGNLTVYVPQFRRNLRFDNVFEITWNSVDAAFAGPGDSGSLVYDPASMTALGLVFAGGLREVDGTRVGSSYACSLAGALETFDVAMLS
ncbi:hypothetical protein [Methylobacterium sp. ID0610]|uniref:hypothetical protein n=1 Tax=Methylobacterium carpenticola TaxID=3344827 RepID=UPI0036BBFB54